MTNSCKVPICRQTVHVGTKTHLSGKRVYQELAVIRLIRSLYRSIWCLIRRGRICRGNSIMKVSHLYCALALLSASNCPVAQCQTHPKLALDSTKPFAYVKFDHTGPRQPLRPDEPSQGLWLRLVNNSVLPISMRVHGSLTDPEMTILEDVVTPRMRTIPKAGFVDYGPMPHGYATAADVTSILTLQPGENVLFSVPVNHVAPGWFLQVAFQFDLPPVKHGAAQPVCYAGFDWDDIPEKSRWVPSSR